MPKVVWSFTFLNNPYMALYPIWRRTISYGNKHLTEDQHYWKHFGCTEELNNLLEFTVLKSTGFQYDVRYNYEYFMWNCVKSMNYPPYILYTMFVLTWYLAALVFVGLLRSQNTTPNNDRHMLTTLNFDIKLCRMVEKCFTTKL